MADLPFPHALAAWPAGRVYKPRSPLLFDREWCPPGWTPPARAAAPSSRPPPPPPEVEKELSDALDEALQPAPPTVRSPESTIPQSDPRPVQPVTEAPPVRRTRKDGPLPPRACATCGKAFQPATWKQECCDRQCGAKLRSRRAYARKHYHDRITTQQASAVAQALDDTRAAVAAMKR